MKILQELKAAQATIDYNALSFHDMDLGCIDGGENIIAVLRRIPQLIDAIEWVEREDIRMDENETKNGGNSECEYGILHVIKELKTRLEGKGE